MSDDYTTTPNYGLYKPTPNADYDLWGDHLNANADKLDAVIRGIAVAGDIPEFQISAAAHGAVPDFVQLAGPVSWNATTVTIAGASFTVADVGKTLIMPAGGVAGAPALVEIVDFTSPTVVTVDQVAGAPFAGADTVVGGYASNPWSIAISSPGAGGSLVGDVLTVVAAAPAIRPATLQVIQTRVASATVVNAGTGGPPGPVLLRGTTGYGRRVVLSGNVNAGGSLDPTLVLTSSTGADPGAYWYDVDDPNGEPVVANPRKITLPGSWAVGGTTITLGSTVSPLVMPAIHPGATVFAVADDGNVAFPTGTRVDHIIDSTAMTIQTTQAATHAGSGQQIAFTDNRQDIVFAATFANAATTITASAPVPAGVMVGQTIFGPGLLGSDDPTTPLANTTITAIDGPRTTITISRPTTHAATTAVNLHAVPYLSGAVVKLNLVPAVIAYKDWGAYAGVPLATGVGAFLVTGGGNPGISLNFAHQSMTVGFGTDNTGAINAWLAAVHAALGTTGQGLEAVLPPGAYLTLDSINAHDLNQPFTMRVSGVSIHSAALNERAWDASGARYYRMVGDFVVVGDKLFPPDIGLLFAYSNVNGITSNVSLTDVSASGFFKFAATYLANTEGYVVVNMQSSNGQTWANKDTPCYGKMIDGDNSFGKLDAPVLQTHASFLGFLEDGGTSTCNNGAVPFSIIGCSNYEIRGGYGASWSAPACFFSKSGHAKLNIHCEVETLTDAVFMWARSNNVVSFGNSEFVDAQLGATNSAVSYDTLGKFGVPIRGLTASNSSLLVTPSGATTFLMQVFDDHSRFTGTHVWHGNISIGGALKTASVHWLANLPDDREGSLLLGDDKTNYSGDFISAGTITSGGIISAGDDISTTAWVNAEDGIRIGAAGFSRATLTYDGTQITSNVPISLPAGSVAVTQAPGEADTSVATTAFVQAAASASLTYTATGGTAPLAATDRAGQWTNIMDFGAHLNGTLSDAAGIGAALAILGTNEPLVIPPGAASVVWGSVQNTTPTTPVLFKTDGVMSGAIAMLQAFNRVGKGDLFESFSNGTKMLVTRSGKADAGGVLRIEHNQVLGGGTGGFVNNILNIVAQDNTAAVSSMWGVNVSMDSYSNQAGWPQNVAGSFSLHKHGKAWSSGVHITADDDQNLPSSTGGALLGLEMGYRTNNVDDAFSSGVYGGAGIRMGLHLSLYEYGGAGAVLPGEISFAIFADGSANSITKSILAVSTDMNTYQVVDARGALPPSGYTSPVAAVRMTDGQIVDFKGGTALNSAAGNYLQHTSTGTARLRLMAGTTELFSISDAGAILSPILQASASYANDAAAATGGVSVGQFYRNGSALQIRVT